MRLGIMELHIAHFEIGLVIFFIEHIMSSIKTLVKQHNTIYVMALNRNKDMTTLELSNEC